MWLQFWWYHESRDSNYLADMAMWLRFCKSNICVSEVIITTIWEGFNQKKNFQDCAWFKVNDLGLALSMALKCWKFHQCGKMFKTKSQIVFRAKSCVCKSEIEKMVRADRVKSYDLGKWGIIKKIKKSHGLIA